MSDLAQLCGRNPTLTLTMLNQLASDFLLRLEQERQVLLAVILAERVAGNDDGALIKIEAACLQKIGMPLGAIRRIPPEGLIEFMQRGRDVTFRSIILAELLLQVGEISEKAGNVAASAGCRLQAFCLIAESFYILSNDEQIRYRALLEKLASELRSISDDPYLRGKVDEYHAKVR